MHSLVTSLILGCCRWHSLTFYPREEGQRWRWGWGVLCVFLWWLHPHPTNSRKREWLGTLLKMCWASFLLQQSSHMSQLPYPATVSHFPPFQGNYVPYTFILCPPCLPQIRGMYLGPGNPSSLHSVSVTTIVPTSAFPSVFGKGALTLPWWYKSSFGVYTDALYSSQANKQCLSSLPAHCLVLQGVSCLKIITCAASFLSTLMSAASQPPSR